MKVTRLNLYAMIGNHQFCLRLAIIMIMNAMIMMTINDPVFA